MRKFHETLYILYKCNLNLVTIWKAIEANEQGALMRKKHFTSNLAYYIILETDSFLHEFDSKFNQKEYPDYKDRIIGSRIMCKPILKRIKIWTGIRKFRNNIIAHPWRSANEFTLPQNKSYKVPRSFFEIQFLKDLIGYVYQIIYSEFEIEVGEALYHAENLKEKVLPLYDFDKANFEIDNMVAELTEIEQELKKDYEIKITKYQ